MSTPPPVGLDGDDMEDYLDRLRADYTYDDFWKIDGSGNKRCATCRDLVEEHSERVPCCGGGYDCYDVLYLYVCHRCRLIGDAW